MRLRRLFESIDEESIKSWIKGHYLGGTHNLKFEIKPDGVEFTSPVTFQISSPEDVPPFKILHLGDDTTFVKCQISDFSFLPQETGELNFEKCTFSEISGLPKKIKGGLFFKECENMESFNGIETHVYGVLTLQDLAKFSKFGDHKIQLTGNGIIVRNTGLSSLENMPKMENVGYVHVGKSKIQNLLGLPDKLSHLYISSCPLKSIEGIPFVITEGYRKAVNISCTNDCMREKVLEQIDLYYELMETMPPQSNEDKQAYFTRILESDPTYATLIPNDQLPKEFSGGSLLKKFGLL